MIPYLYVLIIGGGCLLLILLPVIWTYLKDRKKEPFETIYNLPIIDSIHKSEIPEYCKFCGDSLVKDNMVTIKKEQTIGKSTGKIKKTEFVCHSCKKITK